MPPGERDSGPDRPALCITFGLSAIADRLALHRALELIGRLAAHAPAGHPDRGAAKQFLRVHAPAHRHGKNRR